LENNLENMRIKHRYIICQAIEAENSNSTSSEEYSARDLQNVIKEKVESLYGDVGVGEFGSSSIIKAFDNVSKIFVLRTTREAETNLRLAISCINSVKDKNLILRTLAVAGCSRTCGEKLRSLFNTVVENSNLNESVKIERHQFYANVMSNLVL
jgi:RNase P/RNase MRP subunit POP5